MAFLFRGQPSSNAVSMPDRSGPVLPENVTLAQQQSLETSPAAIALGASDNWEDTSILGRRSRKQLSLFFAGATFLAFSVMITRRSIARKIALTKPTFYHQSNVAPTRKSNAAIEAVEALNLATLNVMSFAVMMTGGTLWALDISTLEELRKKVRGGLGVDGTGRSEQEAEEEIEEWLATVLARKDEKEKMRKELGGKGWTNDRGKER